MSRLVLVSHRLPVTVRVVEGETHLEPSAGGLVQALASVHGTSESRWIGTLGAGRVCAPEYLGAKRLVAVRLDAEQERRHYQGFANSALWPLFHYLPGNVRFDRRDFEAYRAVNERFADAVAAHARPDDLVWVHDYHLMLLPALVRRRLPEARVGFFLHIPFPSSEVFRILPVAEDLLLGLLGADLVGVHTYDYARHMVTCFRRLLGVEFDDRWSALDERRTRLGVFPLGIDANAWAELCSTAAVERRLRSLRRQMGRRKVILGVDRLDYTKGLVHRLESYRRLLQMEPVWRRRAQLIQIVVPSRATIPKYAEIKHEVERLVGEINGDFATDSNVPVRYLYRFVPPEELAALYRLANVALVTPLRDGMNLVCKEYVACRLDDSGVLVLSELAGAAPEMGEALLVNPWDIEGTAQALDTALRMDPEEQRQRMSVLRRRIHERHVGAWAVSFVRALEEASVRQPGPVAAESGATWPSELRAAFAASARPLILLDYDGTLVDLADDPMSTEPDAGLLATLERLSAAAEGAVVVLSGRDRRTLELWLGRAPLNLVAEHGLYLRRHGASCWENLLPVVDLAWVESVRPVLLDYTVRTPGAFIETKGASIAWHYRRADPARGRRHALELAHHLTESLARSAADVLLGANVVEVRPQGVHKGAAYKALVRALGPFDFVLAAGDDRTDEDFFQALDDSAWSIRVGPGFTLARFRIGSPAELRALLSSLHRRVADDQPAGGVRARKVPDA